MSGEKNNVTAHFEILANSLSTDSKSKDMLKKQIDNKF